MRYPDHIVSYLWLNVIYHHPTNKSALITDFNSKNPSVYAGNFNSNSRHINFGTWKYLIHILNEGLFSFLNVTYIPIMLMNIVYATNNIKSRLCLFICIFGNSFGKLRWTARILQLHMINTNEIPGPVEPPLPRDQRRNGPWGRGCSKVESRARR